MSTLPERLQDEYGDALDELWKSRGCNNDDPLYLRFLPYHATIRQLASELQAAQSLQAQEVVKETTINHARDPHCCGCYVIRWNDGDPVAVCGECGVQVALLDRLVSGAPEGGEWRTIDSAPKDGTQILVARAGEEIGMGAVEIVDWCVMENWHWEQVGDDLYRKVQDAPSEFWNGNGHRATHWMPLPAAPSPSASLQAGEA